MDYNLGFFKAVYGPLISLKVPSLNLKVFAFILMMVSLSYLTCSYASFGIKFFVID